MTMSEETGSTAPVPGLQAERTALAWNRTGLAVLVNGLLALRSGWISGQPTFVVAGAVLLAAAAAAVLYGAWRRRHLLGVGGPTAPGTASMIIATLVTLLACLTGLASVAFVR
ncbi:MAG: hypothetical protein JWN09_2496 [Microbacteriaceae bacterium]|nr:hypothetical protein [Microbacteriaceae bacterium]